MRRRRVWAEKIGLGRNRGGGGGGGGGEVGESNQFLAFGELCVLGVGYL